jgi:hypothetical protein
MDKMEQTKISFKDLSGWLKAFVIIGWTIFGLYALTFLIGFIQGMLS